jgi:hypothetical protein
MILIQRLKKIKRYKWFKEILFDIGFYLFFFVLGIIFVFNKLENREERVIIMESDEVQPPHAEAQPPETEKYVASSRGKYFYEVGSSRANSLSEKNKIYFSTPEEAKKLGFKPYFGD